MRIYEYEAKELLAENGIPIPRSTLAHDPDQAREAAAKIMGPVAVKAQTLTKARGKAGLVKFADDPEQCARAASELIGRVHHDEKVAGLLIEEKLDDFTELYLGLVVDYGNGNPVILASPKGGVDIEDVAEKQPDKLLRIPVSPSAGLSFAQAEEVGRFLAAGVAGAAPDLPQKLSALLKSFYALFVRRDLEMLEINPLAVTRDGRVLALDGAAVLDGDALFRQQDLVKPRNQSQEDFARERDFSARGWSYLQLDGDIGILSSGAGITMAILDLMRMWGGKPANFLDTAQMDRKGIYDAFRIFLGKEGVIKTVLVNIFAGLNRCDHLAEGIRDFLTEYRPSFKVVVRMIGNRDKEGMEILRPMGIDPIGDLEAAVKKAIAVTEGK